MPCHIAPHDRSTGEDGANGDLIKLVEDSVERQLWEKVRKGYDAGGIKKPNIEAVRKELEKMRKKAEFKRVGIHENIVRRLLARRQNPRCGHGGGGWSMPPMRR